MGNYKILMVDAESAERRRVAYILRTSGFDVLELGDGFDGLERTVMELPSAIILDKNLPSLTGPELAKSLKGDPATHNIPIVGYSYSAWDGEEALDLDIQVEKPDVSALLDALTILEEQGRLSRR